MYREAQSASKVVAEQLRENEARALVIALVNVVDSPLAKLADEVIPLQAGRETSVAATKSYIATLVALAQLVAAWTQNDTLKQALSALPAATTRTVRPIFAKSPKHYERDQLCQT